MYWYISISVSNFNPDPLVARRLWIKIRISACRNELNTRYMACIQFFGIFFDDQIFYSTKINTVSIINEQNIYYFGLLFFHQLVQMYLPEYINSLNGGEKHTWIVESFPSALMHKKGKQVDALFSAESILIFFIDFYAFLGMLHLWRWW